jgi:hypothetical protein
VDDRRFQPLQALGHVVAVLVACVVAVAAARLIVVQLTHGETAAQATVSARPVVIASHLVFLATALVFVAWLRQARLNAERSDWRQRRARAWAFWGWIIPIASLWIPFQMVGDIWRAGLPAQKQRRVAWLPALWWTSWLLEGIVNSVRTGPRAGHDAFVVFEFPHNWLGFGLLLVAGVTLIAIVEKVSAGPVGQVTPASPAEVALPTMA